MTIPNYPSERFLAWQDSADPGMSESYFEVLVDKGARGSRSLKQWKCKAVLVEWICRNVFWRDIAEWRQMLCVRQPRMVAIGGSSNGSHQPATAKN